MRVDLPLDKKLWNFRTGPPGPQVAGPSRAVGRGPAFSKNAFVHHAFLYISLPSLQDYDLKMPNCKFYGGRKQGTTNLFSLSKLGCTKMAVVFANVFMAKIEKEILRQSSIKPIFWKRFIDDVISVWDTSRNEF